jgi:hypothetical protein
VAVSNPYGNEKSLLFLIIISMFYSKDFPGQKKAERLFQIIIVVFGVSFQFDI